MCSASMDRAHDARAQGGDDAASACRAVVVGLRLSPGWTAAAAYLEQGGRLRLQAVAGTQRVLDGLAPSAGVAGRALRTAHEVVEQRPAVPVLDGRAPRSPCPSAATATSRASSSWPAPRRSRRPTCARRAAPRPASARCSPPWGRQSTEPHDAAARRLLRHAAALAGVEDAERIGPAVLRAALDVAPLRSALLATTTRDGSLEPRWSAGPLGEGLTEAADAATLGALRDAVVHAGSAALTLGRPGTDVPAPLAPLHAAGARTAVVVALRHGGGLNGLLVLADAGAPAPAGADAELLELLAAHAAASLQAAATATALRHRAETDPLTGLGHHATFHAALAGAHRRPLTAVVLADLDGFKALNDTPRARARATPSCAPSRAPCRARCAAATGSSASAGTSSRRSSPSSRPARRAPPETACAPPSRAPAWASRCRSGSRSRARRARRGARSSAPTGRSTT